MLPTATKPGGAAPAPTPALAVPKAGLAAVLTSKYGGPKLKPYDPAIHDDGKMEVILTGPPRSGKTTFTTGFPRKFGGKTYMLTCDRNTRRGLLDYYGPAVLKHVEVYPLVDPQYTAEQRAAIEAGNRVNPEYPGLDASKPWTSEVMLAHVDYLLDMIAARNDGDVIVWDHLQAAWDIAGRGISLHQKGGVTDAISAKLDYQEWGPRAQIICALDEKAYQTAKFAYIKTGYGEEDKQVMIEKTPEEMKAESAAKGGRPVGKTKVLTRPTLPKWVQRLSRNGTFWLDLEVIEERDSEGNRAYRRFCNVRHSNGNDLFPTGASAEVTGTNARVFFKPEETPPDLKAAREMVKLEREERASRLLD